MERMDFFSILPVGLLLELTRRHQSDLREQFARHMPAPERGQRGGRAVGARALNWLRHVLRSAERRRASMAIR
jgi:hypothetical protein